MFLHIGADIEILSKDLIGIFNINSIDKTKITQEFIKTAEEEGFVKIVSKDPPKSVVVIEENKNNMVYFSPISSTTLQKRSNFSKKSLHRI